MVLVIKTPINAFYVQGSFTMKSWGRGNVNFYKILKQIKMKRVLVAAMMLLVTGSVFATDVHVDRVKGKEEVKVSAVQKNMKIDEVGSKNYDCSVSLKGSVGVPPFAGATFTCTGTGNTCSEAWDTVEGCIDEGIRRGKKKFTTFIQSIMGMWPL